MNEAMVSLKCRNILFGKRYSWSGGYVLKLSYIIFEVHTERIDKLAIQKIVNKGYGIGYFNDQTIFVSHAIPGDIVNVQIKGKKGNSLFATIESYESHSSIAIKPGCEVFSNCGGCDWLNVPYEIQLAWKQQIIADIFKRIYPIEQIKPIVGANPPTHYRNKVFMPIGLEGSEPVIGMFARKSHDVIPHKNCILHPLFFDEIFAIIHNHIISANIPVYDEKHHTGIIKHAGIRYSEKTGDMIVIIVTKGRKLPFANVLVKNLLKKFPDIKGVIQNTKADMGNRILGTDEKILFGNPYYMDQIRDTVFRVHYQSFMQIHSHQAENLVSYIDSVILPGENVVDAFSGIGFIGLSISRKCNWVFCIESNEHAVDDTKMNITLNHMNNITCISGKVEDELPNLVKEQKIDTMIFDPPRKGLETEIIPVLAEAKIPRIIYVSCNPSTQYRDVEIFMKNGYKISEIQPFDLFPQTWHVENVVILELE